LATSGEKFSRGYEGGKHPARTKVKPKKTVVTVHHDGHVTATGPEAAPAKKEAEASVKRVKKAVRATKTEERNQAVAKSLSPSRSRAGRIVRKRARGLRIPHAESHTQHTQGISVPSPSDLLDAAKSVVKAAQVGEAGGGKIIRSAAEDEAKNLVKVAKKNLDPSKLPEPAHAPSADELQAFATIAGAGVGAGDAAGITEKTAAKAVQSASDVTSAAKELPRSLVTKIREAPASGVKAVKEAPQKARELPGKVEKAVTTSEGRKAAAKGAGKTAIKHPIRTSVPAAAIVPPGVIPGDASDRARALLTGLARAVEHPGDMATATAHGVLGAFTAPLAITASAIESAKQGNTGPLTEELGTLAGGVEELGKKLISGNPEEVEQTFRHDIGASLFIPGGAVGRAIKDSDAVDSAIGSVRGKVGDRRSAKRDALIADVVKAEKEGSFVSAKHREKIDKLAPVEDTQRGTPYVGKKLGTFREKQRARHTVSRVVSRTEQRGSYAAKGWAKQITKALKRAKFDHKGEDTVADAQRVLNKYGIPLDETGVNFVRMLHESYPELKPGDVPAGVHLDRHSTRWLLDHPDALKDPHVRKAVELFDKQAEKVGTSDRNRYLGVVNSIINPLRKAEGKRPILLPEEQVTKPTADLMDELVKGRDPVKDPWTRKEVLDYAKELREGSAPAAPKAASTDAYDPNIPAVSSRDWFHGTRRGDMTPENLEPARTAPDNLFGQGIYLTSDPKIAGEYSELRGKSDGEPTVYRARLSPKRILDLESKPDPEFAKALQETADSIDYLADEEGIVRASVDAAIQGASSNKEIYRRGLVDGIREAQHAIGLHQLPTSELHEAFEVLSERLHDNGWDALSHVGGKGKQARHQVLVLLNKDAAKEFSPHTPEPPVPGGHLNGKDLAKEIEGTLVDENGDRLMLPPEHGGAEHGVATTRSVAWTPEHEAEFAKQAKAEVRARGLREPAAYVGDELPDALKGNIDSVGHSVGIPLNKIWPSRGEAAMSGNAISDFEHFIHKSVEAPRHRASLVQGIDELVEHGSRKIEGRRAFTDDEARRLENEHKVPPNTAWVRIAALKNFIKEHPGSTSDDVRRVIEEESAHVPSATQELKRDVGAIEFKKGEKLVPMDEHYVDEFLAHMKPIEGVTSIASKGTRLASRMILNSPAFAAIQAVQEGVPMAAALSRDVRHIPQAIKNLKAASKLDPDELAAFKAASGSSAGLFGVPSARELSADGYLDPVRMTAPKPAWKSVLHLLNGRVLGQFDRSRAGLMRELGMEARVIGDLDRASKGFNVWRHSTNNLFKDMEGAAKEMRGMTPDERHAYISEHPELQDRIQRSADGMAGNWNSFTVFEKHFAPLTLFYTFQRYSALWMLYHFPLDHPIVATAMTLLGQVNAKELQKLAAEKGSEPNILDYTMPVYSKGNGEKAVGPYGKRSFPGLSTLQTAGVTGNPSTLIGELPPWLAVPVEAATGKNSYTGRDIEENLLTFMGKQALNLNPAARLFLGLTGSRTAASEAFHEQDPLSEWRSVVDPYIGQTGEQYGNTKKLEKDFATKYGEGKIPSAFDSKAVTRTSLRKPERHRRSSQAPGTDQEDP
jgi:hypothetical protein